MIPFFTADEIARIEASVTRVALLAEMHFVSKSIGVWNGVSELTVNGTDFLPAFGKAQLDGLNFEGGVSADEVTITIPAANDTLLGTLLAETSEIEQRVMSIYLQMFDDDWQPIAAPPIIFFGYMQPPRATKTQVTQESVAGPVRTAQMAVPNIFYNAGLPSGGRNTDRDQQTRSPGDLIYRFAARLRNKQLNYPDF